MGNIESVDGQSEMKHHIMPLKVPMPDPTELEEKFAIVLVSFSSPTFFFVMASKCHRDINNKKKLSKLGPFFDFQLIQLF